MSADNYWYITTHPKGGFTYVMGFMSVESVPFATDTAPSYRTAWDAYMACLEDRSYVEYGATFSPEARVSMGERETIVQGPHGCSCPTCRAHREVDAYYGVETTSGSGPSGAP